jgi:hypothetical protein
MASRVVFALACVCLVLAAASVRADEATAGKDQTPSLRLASGPEQMARGLLEAMKRGDGETFFRLLDVGALYRQAHGRRGSLIDRLRFAAQVRRGIEAEFKDGPAEAFEYEVEGEGPIVTVRVRYGADGEWCEHQVEFAQVGGRTRITPKGMRAFDFGYGPRGPIARTDKDGSAEVAMRTMLEAAKARDVETMLEYIDLKGLYEKQLPEDVRNDIPFEKFREQVIMAAKQAAQEDGNQLDYELVEVKEEGDTATATVRTREGRHGEWKREWREDTVQLEKIDGAWKITIESLAKMGD